ncbi:MAG: GAF domain-containing protein [Verrucomicrobia bacterium]|jgi:light-regulated signal transduction histidine kinase (bacteriophytochrome)|nr:GAF domain-containing protein [Verrucomicrobiota bacterium]
MASQFLSSTPFGQADLSTCEREQVHLPGSIQPHGALLVVRESDHVVVKASANVANYIEFEEAIIGRSLACLGGDLDERVRENRSESLTDIPIAMRCEIGNPAREFDALLHRLPSDGLVIELEPPGPSPDLSPQIEHALQSVFACSSLKELGDQVVEFIQTLTGYDRVMLYRFDEEGHGQVFSEKCAGLMETYLGNWYPASDIPQIARRLYQRNRMRMLVDVDYTPVRIVDEQDRNPHEDFDMSLCFLRSMSPIHIQYLKNMGVSATLVASLVVGGRLWGLIACHHYSPRFVPYEIRAACELLAETIATRITAIESFARAQSELAVRHLEERVVEAMRREGDWKPGLFAKPHGLLDPLKATGAALFYEEEILTTGQVPSTEDLREIKGWLKENRDDLVVTSCLGEEDPDFTRLRKIVSGLIAVPVSAGANEFLVWFRPERVHTMTWGGDPNKPFIPSNDPSELSPRQSFAKWHQQVEGRAEPWNTGDVEIARMIGETISDIVLQFRTLRMLVVQDQLDQIKRRVKAANELSIIADENGDVILGNRLFELFPHVSKTHLKNVTDVSSIFTNSEKVLSGLVQMITQRRPWYGEVELADAKETKTWILRGDPVLSPSERLLGFVLILTDVSARKAAEQARHALKSGIIQHHEIKSLQEAHIADERYSSLISDVVGNAQRAAMEVADSVEVGTIPKMLEAIRSSVMRTDELLQRLMRHAATDQSQNKDGTN